MHDGYIFISDFFAEDIVGGAELNNEELIKILKNRGNEVTKRHSHKADPRFILTHLNHRFIISNFVNLPSESLRLISQKCGYVLYEHDHKYLASRDPALYPNFKAPKDKIINLDFYKNANSVFCQSKFHFDIVHLNTGLENLENVSGNLWSEDALELLEQVSLVEKEDYVAIMETRQHNKKMQTAIEYCIHKKMKYRLISSSDNKDFLRRLGANSTLAFFPSTPETLSRIVCEARMMGMKITVNKLVGATKEEWFSLKGKPLIDLMRQKRDDIVDLVENSFENPASNK
tara:strand:+ start:419 stop:1282 length:864 start_codon:yes stop_codon:yes gene_type:complete